MITYVHGLVGEDGYDRLNTAALTWGYTLRYEGIPLLRWPITRWPFLTVNTSIDWRHTYWTESLDALTGQQVQNPISRSFLKMQIQISGPVLVKVWDTPNSGYSERMKHVIEPWLN